MTDTIFALSSGSLPAAIAVVRISGPAAFDAVAVLAGSLPPPRRAGLRTLRHDGEALDRALVLIFPGPNTATGEDLAELHLHGGRAVVRAIEQALGAFAELRPAEAGEFTRRALANGRIDLTAAEGLGDLLAAETEGQRRAAMRAADGGIRRLVEDWAARTLRLSALVEASLDHADEDDVDPTDGIVTQAATALACEIGELTARPGVERLRDGIRIILAGPPNAGKSTLLNALANRDAAIVSPIAGTTRDRIEVPVMRRGVAYLLVDTAGLRDATDDAVEAIGIERAHQALENADLILWLDDVSPGDRIAGRTLWLNPRCDLAERSDGGNRRSVSAATGAGIEALWLDIEARSGSLLPLPDAIALNDRQRSLAQHAASALASTAAEIDPLLQAEHLRTALRSFHRITGAADVEAMLDALFVRFCIGK